MDLLKKHSPAAHLAALFLAGCATTPSTGSSANPAQEGHSYLVALLPMNEGYGTADHDEYERRISPITADNGMTRDSAFTLVKHLGGTAPANASTLGIWSLRSPASLQEVMGDPRYLNETGYRDRLHDMQHAKMFMTTEAVATGASFNNQTVLVGVLTMKPGFGFDDHVRYEKDIAAVTARHGMHLVRSFRVAAPPQANTPSPAVVALWTLPNPDALGAIMQDPDYQANVPNRDRIHDMANTTLYFAQSRVTK